MTSLSTIIEEARPYFVGVELFDRYVGSDIVEDGDEVVLLFHERSDQMLFGVSFPAPAFPQEGLAYRGVFLRNARDWILDLKVVLTEEIATGILFTGEPLNRPGWTQFPIAPERWRGTPGRVIGEWKYP